MIKILNLELVILLEYESIKKYFQKVTLRSVLKKFLWLKKLKVLYRGLMLLMILTAKKLLELFRKINCKETNIKKFRFEKAIKEKGDQLYGKWKGYNNSFNSWIDKMT